MFSRSVCQTHRIGLLGIHANTHGYSKVQDPFLRRMKRSLVALPVSYIALLTGY